MAGLTEVQIVRAECADWEESTLGCYISSNNKLLEVITPINSQHDENKVEISENCNLRLILKSMGEQDDYVGSVTIPAKLLPSQGYVWLPLRSEMNADFLEEIPEHVEPPRILLSVSSLFAFDFLKSDTRKTELQQKKNQLIQDNLNKTLSICHEKLSAEKTKKKQLEMSVHKLKNQLSEALQETSKREESVLALLQLKDNEILELSMQNNRLSLENKRLAEANKHLEESLLEEPNAELTKEVKRLKRKLEEYEKYNKELQNSLLEIGQEWNSSDDHTDKLHEEIANLSVKLEEKDNQIDKMKYDTDIDIKIIKEESLKLLGQHQTDKELLSARIEQLELTVEELEKERNALNSQIFELQQSVLKEKNVKTDSELETALTKTLKEIGLDGKFSRLSDNYYSFEGNKVSLALQNSKVMVKIGGGYINLNDYVNLCLPICQNTPINNFPTDSHKSMSPTRHKRHRTLDLDENMHKKNICRETMSSANKTRAPRKSHWTKPFK